MLWVCGLQHIIWLFQVSSLIPTTSFGKTPNFSNLNESDWISRSKQYCKEIGQKHCDANTKKEQKEIEREYGIWYTVLNDLPYFNSARMCIIDPMHNLLLGTTKHMLEVWKALDLISVKDFQNIQQMIELFVIPEIRHLPKNVASGFSSFTAEQHKNWAMYYWLIIMSKGYPSLSTLQLLANFCQIMFLVL